MPRHQGSIRFHRALLRVWFVALSLALAACGDEAPPQRAPADAAKPVVTEPAAERVLPRIGSAPAEVRSANESELSADVTARVDEVVADVGSTVEEGDTLLRLDARDYRLALEQAEARAAAAQARLDLATQRLARARELVREQFVSEDEVQALQAERDAAAAELRVARADRAVAARNVAKTRIVAPFDGVVVERFAQVGTLAAAGTPLLRVVQSEGIELEASIQASEAAGFAAASERVFEQGGRRYEVRLLRMAPVVERAARTQVARLAFVDEPAPVGSAGTLRWRAPGQSLPPDLLVRRDGVPGYFIVEQGRARFIEVPDAESGRAFDVDVAPDARLVVSGQQALVEGDAVRDAASVPGAAASPAESPAERPADAGEPGEPSAFAPGDRGGAG